jgi:predicted alpha/beta hydrolase
MVHDVFLKYKSMHKFQIGDWAVLDQERVRIQDTYTTRAGTPMYTIGSSICGDLDIEAEDIDNQIN